MGTYKVSLLKNIMHLYVKFMLRTPSIFLFNMTPLPKRRAPGKNTAMYSSQARIIIIIQYFTIYYTQVCTQKS